MSLFLLYVLMLKATLTSFNGPSSLPILRDDLVVRRHVLTDRQLNAAVVAGRCSPGPMGIYVVSVGYFVAGIPGAFAGFLAMITPAFLIIPLLRYVGHRAEDPRIRGTLNAAVIASVGLILCSAVPLAKDAITGWFPLVIGVASIAILAFTRIETIWIILGSVAAGALARLLGSGF
jgi:chromate transporter